MSRRLRYPMCSARWGETASSTEQIRPVTFRACRARAELRPLSTPAIDHLLQNDYVTSLVMGVCRLLTSLVQASNEDRMEPSQKVAPDGDLAACSQACPLLVFHLSGSCVFDHRR